ncbi:hypothetical protein CAPTEDRAFT_219589 [Capitella teleta]|uniref:SH3 and PX domain-containing protein 2A n=1 Tax=Capitella teleta TaxID=283909 RepID=R7UDF6_CAPTE|nr:hypothetical protein CAPTEDRAFT_219589 [Capitella teleta]|eukprot:ELU04141.1 hypothetical protein CAPTEDRAFT_219589 [Capitella teleta]
MSQRTVQSVCVEDVEKRRHPSKHYVFVIRVTWSDDDEQIIYRRYSQFFDLQCRLLDEFPDDAGEIYPMDRIIPFLPGKILFGRSHIREVALKRLDPINDYCRDLIRLPSHISQCTDVLTFFETRQEDINPQRDPPKKKADHSPIKEISDPTTGEQYIAVADYEAGARKTGSTSHDVSLTAGETVEVLEKNEKGWWFVSCEEGQGWVPSSFLERTDGQEEQRAVDVLDEGSNFVCVHDYHPQYQDELKVNKGSSVKVLEKNLDGWWLAEFNGEKGRVPACYLSHADTQRAQHKMRKPESPEVAVEIIPNLAMISEKHKNSGPLPPHMKSNLRKAAVRTNSDCENKSNKSKAILSLLRHPFTHSKTEFSDDEGYPDESTPHSVRKGGPPPRPGTIRRSVWLVDGRVQGAVSQEESIYQAVSSFDGSNISGGTSVTDEDVIQVLEKSESGWWYVRTPAHKEGWIPSSIINKKLKSMVSSPKPKPRKIPPPRPQAPPTKVSANETSKTEGIGIMDMKAELASKFNKFVSKMSPTPSPRSSRKLLAGGMSGSPQVARKPLSWQKSQESIDDSDDESYFTMDDGNNPEEGNIYENYECKDKQPPQPPSAAVKPIAEPPKPPLAALKPTNRGNKSSAGFKPNGEPPKPPSAVLKPSGDPPKPPPAGLKPSCEPPKPPSAALKPNCEPPKPPSAVLKPSGDPPNPPPAGLKPNCEPPKPPSAALKPSGDPPNPPPAGLKPNCEPPKPPSAALKPNCEPPKPPSAALKPASEPPKPPIASFKPFDHPPKPPCAAAKPSSQPKAAIKPTPPFAKPASPLMKSKFSHKPTACVKPEPPPPSARDLYTAPFKLKPPNKSSPQLPRKPGKDDNWTQKANDSNANPLNVKNLRSRFEKVQ